MMKKDLKKEASEMMHKMKEHRWIVAVVAVMLVVGLVAFCHSPKKFENGRNLPVGEAFDSLTAMLPKGSTIVARFPDDHRADLYYLNSGVLYCFNGKSKLLEEMSVPGITNGSVINASLSQDEKYIMLTVREDKLDKLFRLNTENRNIVDLEKSTAVPDEQKEEEEKPKQSTGKKSEVPVITDPLPEAAFADEPVGAGHEVKAEPKKSDPDNKPEVTTISTD
ncbi:MAG: hypothetical protein IKT22_01720 [Prevotella sp.]|nr:hypothetical protein [Prevotella sp.]MBR6016277.1 hypothetical protein [Prevotella sp.]MBR6445774.1 hypothetical protein [Prevotella sp.]MBR6493975.1 hypothetical protein [Prevotella sp.]